MDEENLPDLRVRRSAWPAGIALVLLVMSAFAPWWLITNDLEGYPSSQAYGLWSGSDGWAHEKAVWVTVAAVLLPLPILFVRVAARSWVHEPKSWRRDLLVCLGLTLLALVSCWAWPVEGSFWTGPREAPYVEGGTLHITQEPTTGWWLAFLAFLSLALAAQASRAPATEK